MKRVIHILFLLLISGGIAAQNSIQYEYWFDEDYPGKTSNSMSGEAVFRLETSISCTHLNEGIHNFHFRSKDNSGYWSSVASSYFYKIAEEKVNNLVAYEYWLDDNYKDKVNGNISAGENVFQLQTSVVASFLEEGIHSFHFRARDQAGYWSQTTSSWFYKIAKEKIDNNLVAYEYWINDNYDKRIAKQIENQQPFLMAEDLDISLGTRVTNVIHFRFEDKYGQWSSVVSTNFWRPVEPDFTHIVGLSEITFTNTSKYADKYEWDFGDGSTSNQVNPLHTYAEPGAYEVKLIAQNEQFTDSIFHYVEIEGIRAISTNKGGNRGTTTLIILGGGFSENAKVKLIDGNNNEIIGFTKLVKPGELNVIVELFGCNIGFYDLSIENNGKQTVLNNFFEITNENNVDTWLDFSYRESLISGRWQTIDLIVGNNGNSDAIGVPMFFAVSHDTEVEFLFEIENELIEFDDEMIEVPEYIEIDSLYNSPFKGKLYSFFLSALPASSKYELKIKINSNNSVNFYAWLGEDFNEYYLSDILRATQDYEDIATCILDVIDFGFAATSFGKVPPGVRGKILNCTRSLLSTYAKEHLQNNGLKVSNFLNRSMFTTALGCILPEMKSTRSSSAQENELRSSTALPLVIIGAIVLGYKLWSVGDAAFMTWYDCKYAYNKSRLSPRQNVIFNTIAWDPNEILGPSGYGNEKYIQKKEYMNYTLYFENDAEKATAPAQEIFLTDTLDLTKFDPEKFSFDTFTFRDITVEAIPGLYEFSKDIDMRDRGENIIIRITATFDKEKGIINCRMIALDPETMDLTESPFLGIVYPNATPPIGEGNVTYRIRLRDDVGDGSVIQNQGHIIFDLNEPIATNVYVNTIDMSKPTSTMSSTYQIENDSVIVLSWSGTDTGSGIVNYSVYVSENDDDYYPWISRTEQTSTEFEITEGITYKFFVIATDNVGNMEDMKSNAELTVFIEPSGIEDVSKNTNGFSVVPNPVDGTAVIEFTTDTFENIKLNLYNVSGQKVLQVYDEYSSPGKKQINLNVSTLNRGIYFLKMETSEQVSTCKVIVK